MVEDLFRYSFHKCYRFRKLHRRKCYDSTGYTCSSTATTATRRNRYVTNVSQVMQSLYVEVNVHVMTKYLFFILKFMCLSHHHLLL